MADIKIIIDGQVAELPPNGLNLPLTYSLRSREGLAINSGSRSEYSFELPATKHNDDIFNQFYDPATYTILEQAFLSASIEVDGLPFFIGRCQLQSVTLRQDQYFWQGRSYKVAFYGNNADWSTRIGDLLIKDLPFTAHTYSYNDNITAWNNQYPTWDYKYILLKLKDYTTFGQVDGLEDSHPALFIAGIIDKIFASVGYTVVSGFFITDFFKRLIMPVPILNRYLQGQYGQDYLNVSVNETINDPNGNYFPVVFTNQTLTPPNPPNPYNVAGFYSGFYLAPVTGYYVVRFRIQVFSTVGTWGMDGGIIKNGSFGVYLGATYFNISALSTGNFDLSIESQVINLTAGEYIGLELAASCTDPSTYFVITMDVIGEAEIVDGFNLDLKYIIDPSLKAIDLIRGLAHAFNLVFETNEGSRTVYIEPADDYIIESRPATLNLEDGFYTAQKAIDYTPFVDLSKGGELVSDTKQLSQLRLKWKDDSNDPTVEALNQNENLGILEARFQFSLNRFKVGENVIDNPFFAPTLVLADNEPQAPSSTRTPMVPIIWAVNYLETSTSTEIVSQILPRLLVAESIATGYENGTINVYNGVAVVDYKTPLNYMIDYNDTIGFQTSLSFGDVTVNGLAVAGLLKRFYLSEMVRRSGGKYLELFILWDVLKIQNLTFRDKIFINNNTYILQEINTFDVAKNQSTKTYFVLDNKEVGAEGSIRSTILEAKINTV
jgi:hypothetical protein